MIRSSAFFPGHCTVTWTVVVCEIAPDWAVTMIEAVPRFGCVLLLYPPQPLITSPSAAIAATAVAGSSEARATRTLLARGMAKLNKTNARRRAQGPSRSGVRTPYCETLAEVVTVNVVLAAPLAGVTVAGLKAHVIPIIGGQENVTLFAKPPPGLTVSVN